MIGALTLAFALAARPDTPGTDELFAFEATDTVETHDSTAGAFKIHYTRAGVNAVPAADADTSGVPDHVERLADLYEDVLAFYLSLGFRAPLGDAGLGDDGGDERFDVYLVDFGFSSDGAFRREACEVAMPDRCAGYMVQENDFAGYNYPSTTYANRVLASHEFFHAVQAAYDSDQGGVLGEGTAVWATERFDPSLFDLENFTQGYMEEPDHGLSVDGSSPVNDFTYGAGIFFQFLDERFGDDVVLRLWEVSEDGAGGVEDPFWFDRIDPLLQDEFDSSFADAFAEFAIWNLYTGPRADPSVSYASGDDYATLTMQQGDAPYSQDKLRVFKGSAQYFAVDPVDNDELVVRVIGTDIDLDGVRVAVTVRDGAVLSDPVFLDDLSAPSEPFAAGAADEVIVVVINTRTDGDSRRPGFCVAGPDELDDCVATVLEERGEAPVESDGGPVVEPPPVCGCDAAPSSSLPAQAAVLVLAVVAFGRRRRSG